jgi:hypothetical protein
MSSYAALIKLIASNPSAHAVNREEKMDATIDAMCKNLEFRHKVNSGINVSSSLGDRGYGKGRKMGD